MTTNHRPLRHAAFAAVTATSILLGAAATTLGVAAPASAATTTPIPASEIKALAIEEAKKQGAARDYTPPLTKPRWKVLFLAFADVAYTNGTARQTMNTDERTYTQSVANQFEAVLEKHAGVEVEANVKWVNETFTSNGGDPVIHEDQIADILKQMAGPAEYDSILVTSKGVGGLLGITMPRYFDDGMTRGSAYSYASIRPYWSDYSAAGKPGYPGTTAEVDFSTNIAVHEFAHQMSRQNGAFPYPNLHNSGGYGYVADPKNEMAGFYIDYLTGKVKVDGVPQGTYPKMWAYSQRFVHNPAMATVHYQDASGRTIAPDANAFGAGGDPYSIQARALAGYKSVTMKTGSAPAAGKFVTGTKTEITFVYSPDATKVTFVGGETTDLHFKHTVGTGTVNWHGFTYRAAVPLAGYTYTDRIDAIDGGRRCDSLPGVTLTWDASGTARFTKDGNSYTAVKKSDTLVEISVALGTPSTDIRISNLGYGSTAPIGRVQQTLELLDITPQLTGTKEATPGAPKGHNTVTWGDYKVKLTFSGGETTDINTTLTLNPGQRPAWRYAYRTSFPITGYTYLDRLTASDGVTRLDCFEGTPIAWNAAGTATLVRNGNTVTLVKKSDTVVEVTYALSGPVTSFTAQGMDYTNSAATGRATRSIEFTHITPESTGIRQAVTAGKANITATWGAYKVKVTFSGGETTDLTAAKVGTPGFVYWSPWSYRTAVPVTGYTYTDRIDAIDTARRVDSLNGIQLTWDAAGRATFTKDDNTYTAVKKSATLVEISVTLATPTTVFTLRDLGYGSTGPVAQVRQSLSLLTVTPQMTGTKETVTAPEGHVTLTWGDYKAK